MTRSRAGSEYYSVYNKNTRPEARKLPSKFDSLNRESLLRLDGVLYCSFKSQALRKERSWIVIPTQDREGIDQKRGNRIEEKTEEKTEERERERRRNDTM